jgi:hypothetical protein
VAGGRWWCRGSGARAACRASPKLRAHLPRLTKRRLEPGMGLPPSPPPPPPPRIAGLRRVIGGEVGSAQVGAARVVAPAPGSCPAARAAEGRRRAGPSVLDRVDEPARRVTRVGLGARHQAGPGSPGS